MPNNNRKKIKDSPLGCHPNGNGCRKDRLKSQIYSQRYKFTQHIQTKPNYTLTIIFQINIDKLMGKKAKIGESAVPRAGSLIKFSLIATITPDHNASRVFGERA